MTNANLAVWITDWHSRTTATGATFQYTLPTYQRALARHLTSLEPALMLLTGDCRHGFGNALDLQSFQDDCYSLLSPTPYVLRGNHDEDQDVGNGTATGFTGFDAAYPNLPYHWTVDWTAANVRFMGIHTYIIHSGADQDFAQIDASEITWLTSTLAALPGGMKAIVCAHFPLAATFGNYIHASHGGTELAALLAANNTQIVGYFAGHRHQQCLSTTQDSILHISGGAVAVANGTPGFMLLEYVAGSNAIKVHYRQNDPAKHYGYWGTGVYTTLTINL